MKQNLSSHGRKTKSICIVPFQKQLNICFNEKQSKYSRQIGLFVNVPKLKKSNFYIRQMYFFTIKSESIL